MRRILLILLCLVALRALGAGAGGSGLMYPDWSPLCIPNCSLYYTGDGGMGLTATNGVGNWLDYSGNGRHATQPTLANQPGATNNAVNGHRIVGFDGFRAWMDCNTVNGSMMNSATNQCTIFTAILTTSTSKNRVFSTEPATHAGWLGMYCPYSDGNIYWETANQTGGQGRLTLTIGTGLNSRVNCVTFTRTTATATVRTNGVQLGTGSTTQVAPGSNGEMYIGAYGPGTQDFMRGQMYILVDYNRFLTSAETLMLERWICAKIGLRAP